MTKTNLPNIYPTHICCGNAAAFVAVLLMASNAMAQSPVIHEGPFRQSVLVLQTVALSMRISRVNNNRNNNNTEYVELFSKFYVTKRPI